MAKNKFDKNTSEAIERKIIHDRLQDFYQNTKQNQGFIGKGWDKIKEILNFKSSTKYTDEVLKQYTNDVADPQKESEAILATNNYAKSQFNANNFTRNVVASFLGGTAFSLISKIKTASKHQDTKTILGFVAATAISGLSSILLKTLDAKSANRNYSNKEKRNDVSFGVMQGILSASACLFASFIPTKNNSKILNFLTKRGCRLVLNIISLLSLSKFENSLATKMFKFANPKAHEKMIEHQKTENESKNYQFYNPRLELTKSQQSSSSINSIVE